MISVVQPIECSRPVSVAELNRGPLDLVIDASEGERQALASRFGLSGIARLQARVRVGRETGTGTAVVISGQFEAVVSQICVVTLEPFASVIEDRFRLRFVPGPLDPGDDPATEDVDCDLDGEDTEVLFGGAVDVGEVLAQYFGLALDPHPRAPGAMIDTSLTSDTAIVEANRPFAQLLAARPGVTRA